LSHHLNADWFVFETGHSRIHHSVIIIPSNFFLKMSLSEAFENYSFFGSKPSLSGAPTMTNANFGNVLF
jgi:hypothetical protein